MAARLDLPERYVPGRVLGEGGQSLVIQAHDRQRHLDLALKTLADGVDADLGRALMRREFLAMAGIGHPGVVAVHDFGTLRDGRPFFTMDLAAGAPLTEALRGAPEPVVLLVLSQCLDALDHIHSRGVLHGDVKPSNIFVAWDAADGRSPRAVILDFGLAIVPDAPRLLLGSVRGSVAYMAPEVIRDGPVDSRADLYALGATFYEALAGVPPFSGERPEEVLRRHLDMEPPALSLVAPAVTAGLAGVVERLLQKEPRRRYPSARAARADVLALCGERAPGVDGARHTALVGAFVGREPLMDLAMVAVQDAAGGHGGVLVLEGPEGSGKSRLLLEIRARAGLLGALPVRSPEPAAIPYGPWKALASALFERASAHGIAVEGAGLFADPAAPEAPDEGGDLDADGRRARLFERSCQTLSALLTAEGLRQEVVVLMLDDLDRRDAGTREFLHFLSRQLKGLPLCIVATVTSGGGQPRAWDDARAAALPPLTLTQVAQLAASMLGVEELPRLVASRIHDESGGNPADVEDFVRALAADDALRVGPAGEVTLLEDAIKELPLPRRMAEFVKRQISGLSAECRVALSVASLLPEPFPPSLLSAALGFSEELTFEVLGQLESHGTVRCRFGSYAVAGAKLRRHLVDGLAASSRKDLMDRVARALLEARQRLGSAAVPDALLGTYLESGKRPQDAVPYLMAASADAYSVLAVRDSIDLLKRALALVVGDPEGIDPEVLATARETLADRLAEAGDIEDAVGILETLMQDAEASPSRPRDASPEVPPYGRLGLKLAKLYQRRGEYERAHDQLREVLHRLDRERDAAFISEVLARIGWIYKSRGIYSEALKYSTRALKVATEVKDLGKIANALNHLGVIHYNKGDMVQAHVCYRRALGALQGIPHDADEDLDERALLAKAGSDPVRSRVIVNNLGNVHWKRGEWERATECYETSFSFAERVGDLSGVASAANNLALIHYGRGEWDAAIAGFRRSLDIKAKLGEAAALAVGLNNLAEVYERVGQWREARDHYERSLEIENRLGDRKGLGEVLLTLGNLYRKMGEIPRAAEEILRGFDLLKELGATESLAFGYYYRALLEKDREDYVAALRLITEAINLVERHRTLREAGRIYTSAADLYVRMGDLDKASEFADRSLQLARDLGDRFEEGKVLSVVGRIRYQRRERASAREAFEQGITALEELGARFELARSLYEYGLRIEDPARAARYMEKAIGIFRNLGAHADLERASGSFERIRENLQGFDARESRAPGEVVGLYEIGKVINSIIDMDEVLDRVMDIVLERTRADRGLILLLEGDGSLKVRAARNIARENLKGISDISAGIVHEVIRSQGPVMAGNAALDPRFSTQKSVILHGIVSIAAVPLRIRDRIAGAIYLDHLKAPDYFTDRDLKFLQAFADQAAIAIENARLYRELREASDRLAAENRVLRAESLPVGGAEAVGTSRPFRQTLQLVQKAANTGQTTLLLGESGTGKSFLARALHDLGPRKDGPFVKFNCAALPETLVESELFGHEKGAFTGADRRKLGRFEIASNGTIFIDEIGHVPPSVQTKLLRILEDKEFERVGGTQTIKTDVQIVAATNRDLDKAIREGAFREDLFYRLNVFPVQVPALRDRKDDIPLLADRFLAKVNAELGLDKKGLAPDAVDVLTEHDWPGNVRELESAVRRAAVLAGTSVIRAEDLRWLRSAGETAPRREVLLDDAIASFVRSPRRGEKLFQAVTENVERVLIRRVLQDASGQIREAARRLGVARNTLRSKMRRYGLAVGDDDDGDE